MNYFVFCLCLIACLYGINSPVVGQDCSQTGVTLSNYSGTFNSPGYPNNYPNNAECVWTIVAQGTDETTVMLDVCPIVTEMSTDYVAIYDCDNQMCEEKKLAVLSGSNYTTCPPTIYSSGKYLTVVFYSDANNNFTGFLAKYTSETACKAPRQLTERSGTIASPYYPETYSSNKTCTWELAVPQDEVVEIEIVAFDVGVRDTDCSRGYVEVRLSTGENVRLCGTENPKTVVLTSSATIVFVSPPNVEPSAGQGFLVRYEQKKSTDVTTTSPDDSSTADGNFATSFRRAGSSKLAEFLLAIVTVGLTYYLPM